MVIKGYSQYETYLGQKKEPGPRGDKAPDHFANFITAVRKRDKSLLNGPVETAHSSSALAHLGNIAFRLDRVLKFNPETEHFIGDEEANRMLSRLYRKPFVIPEKV
jgi:GFO/IDH/MocA oxidoreductase family protein